MSAQRWERLRLALEEDDVEAAVVAKAYTEDRHGRVDHGVSRSITLRPASGWLIEVEDRWWSKNPDTWLGWVVTLSGPDSLTRGQTRPLKRRAEVVAAVRLYTEAVPSPSVGTGAAS